MVSFAPIYQCTHQSVHVEVVANIGVVSVLLGAMPALGAAWDPPHHSLAPDWDLTAAEHILVLPHKPQLSIMVDTTAC